MLRQAAAVAGVALTNLPARWAPSVVVIASIAGVTGVFVALLAMAQGFQQTLRASGRADRAVILGPGLDNGTSSAISREQLPIVLDAPGIARDGEGLPLAIAQKFMVSEVRRRGSGEEAGVSLRGVSARWQAVWPEITLTAGRPFNPGKRELIAGRGAADQFQGIEIGREVEMVNGPWRVVGTFAAAGSAYESELWGDVEMVFPGYSITGHFSSVTAVLETEASLQQLADFITANPRLNNSVKREIDFYAEQGGGTTSLLRTVGLGIAAIMALGALFSAINTLYASVAARTLEIGTLRAIGFGSAPVVVSVLLEGAALCLLGALLGTAAAWLLFDGRMLSTFVPSGGQLAFAFRVTPSLAVTGVVAAVMLGLLGGLLPAIRAARLPVAEALRHA